MLYHLEFILHPFKELFELRHRLLSSIALLPTEKREIQVNRSYEGILKASSHPQFSSCVSLFIYCHWCPCLDIMLYMYIKHDMHVYLCLLRQWQLILFRNLRDIWTLSVHSSLPGSAMKYEETPGQEWGWTLTDGCKPAPADSGLRAHDKSAFLILWDFFLSKWLMFGHARATPRLPQGRDRQTLTPTHILMLDLRYKRVKHKFASQN